MGIKIEWNLLQWHLAEWDDGDEDDDTDRDDSRISIYSQNIRSDLVAYDVTEHEPANNCHRAVEGEL